jgi:hypothetical protein
MDGNRSLIKSDYLNTFGNFHEYVLDEYKHIFEGIDIQDKYSIPSSTDIVKGAYEQLYQNIADALKEKVQGNARYELQYELSSEIYSGLFDQHFSLGNLEEHPVFHRLIHDVEKYFSLYQLFYRDGDRLVHQPIVEVW